MSMSLDEMLKTVAEGFREARQGGSDTMWFATNALRVLLTVAELPRVQALSPDTVREAADAIATAAEALIDAAEPNVTAANIHCGLAAAVDLTRDFALRPIDRDDLAETMIAEDRFDHAALLLAELEMTHRRRRIAERGNPLYRLVQFRSADAVQRDGRPLH